MYHHGLEEIDDEADNVTEILDFYGEIMVIDDDNVVVDCLIDTGEKKFQLRRFDRLPFENVMDLNEGRYVSIKVITRPGSKIFRFSGMPASDHLKALFSKDDYFGGIDESIFNEQ